MDLIKAFDTARAEGWFIGEMIWNFAGIIFVFKSPTISSLEFYAS